jgi:dienelactone hydrolase
VPRGVTDAPGILLVHGVHHLGVDEPRLVRFARALAESGILVMTPEIRELADYHVDPRSIATIGEAARRLRERAARPVGVIGMSFAGGLALLAAADARFAPDIKFVVAVGAHDDLGRVSRFFATGSIARPDGTLLTMRAHDYGPMVLVYSHVDDFFAEGDVPFARSALRAWLWEDRDGARAHAASMSPEGRARMDLLFGGHVDALAAALLDVIARRGTEMGPVSPRGRLGSIHVPVYLLHGAGDSVIPSTETLWLAREVPPAELRDVLVSPALVHVELDGDPTLADRWSLVHFMADVLEEAQSH